MSVSPRDLHISAPEMLSRPARARDTVFTALMWGVYIYLWVPLVSLFAWLLGIEFAYEIMIRQGGSQALLEAIWFYASIMFVIFIVVTVWSLHNRLSYGHLNRRLAPDPVSTRAMADWHGLAPDEVERLRRLGKAAIEFDSDGRPAVTGLLTVRPD